MSWQPVIQAAFNEHGVDALADQAIEALERVMPLLRDDPDLRELARRSSAATLLTIEEVTYGGVSLTELEPPPPAVAFARELARRNIPSSELTRSYRIAQRTIWRFGVAEIRRVADPADVPDAMQEYTDATFATADVLMGRVLERYAAERDRWVRSADAVRRATIQDLLSDGASDVDAASARLRYELRRSHVAFVVWAESDDAVLESTATAVGGAGALVVSLPGGIVAGWTTPDNLVRDALPGRPADTARVAWGRPGDGIAGFRSSHAEALEARRVARVGGFSGAVAYDDVALAALLTKDLEQARAFAERELGALAAPDPATRRLADTVLELLRAQGSPRRAGAALGLHENTVAKRVRAAEELLGRPADERVAETLAALVIVTSSEGRDSSRP